MSKLKLNSRQAMFAFFKSNSFGIPDKWPLQNQGNFASIVKGNPKSGWHTILCSNTTTEHNSVTTIHSSNITMPSNITTQHTIVLLWHSSIWTLQCRSNITAEQMKWRALYIQDINHLKICFYGCLNAFDTSYFASAHYMPKKQLNLTTIAILLNNN